VVPQTDNYPQVVLVIHFLASPRDLHRRNAIWIK